MKTPVAALALTLLSSLAAAEAPKPAPGVPAAGANPLVSLEFEDRPFGEVTDYLGRLSGMNIVPAPELAAQKVSVHLVTLDWKKALKLVADQVGGYVEDAGPNLVKVSNLPRVTYTTLTTGNDIKEVLTVIAEFAGANIVVADSVKGKVNLRLKDVPWKHAVQQAVKAAGDYAVVEEDFNLLRVVPASALANQIENRVFTLRYLHAPANYKATLRTNYALARDYTSSGKSKEMNPALVDFTLFQALKGVLSPTIGKLSYDGPTNTIIATDVKPKLDEIQRIIELMDVEPVQILVDVKFVTTSNTDLFDFGIDWGGANGTTGLKVSGSGGSMLHRLPFNLGYGGFEDQIGITQGPTGENEGPNSADTASPVSTITGKVATPFTFGTLDFSTVSAVLKLFKRDVETKVVQSPKVVTLDNEEATIFVGDTIRYAQTEASSSSSGALTFTLREVDTPVRIGFQLYVVPHIIPGTSKMMMTVIPESNVLSGAGTFITGFDHYTNGSQTIDLPRITSRTLVTKMMLEDGQTVILGGLMQENATKATNKLPVLGDIPLLGWLFKSKDNNIVQDNLIIFITPRIIRSGSDTQRNLLEELKSRDKILREEVEGPASK